MSTVTSAYNFVPINEKVCLPGWRNAVSQDIPLQGAVSGEIDLTITAKTPIFVRGKSTVPDPEKHQKYEFMKHNGQYCIPGSSIKGTIANVLEILSFGKLNRINDHRFSQRDWNNEDIYDKQSFARRNKGGWLYYDKKAKCYKIDYNTKSIGRIEHRVIDAHFETNFQEIFGQDFDPSITGENKSALKKYKLLRGKKLRLENAFVKIPIRERFEQQKYSIHLNEKEAETGTIVFSGQPSKREQGRNGQWRGKNKEFIFWDPDAIGVLANDELIKDFRFAYYDNDPKQRTTDWDHWRKVLEDGGRVPIFLQLDHNKKDENGNKLPKHFGLSMLYKLPFKNRIKNLLPKSHNNTVQNDFVETLFGYSIDKKSNKGRVSFLPAFTEDSVGDSEEKTLVLGEPKASYYPFYLAQTFHNTNTTQINGVYKTYNNNTVLAGRKRYPIKAVDQSLGAEKTAFSTTFMPLPADTTFKGKIIYHNLLPEELGALLCALTFNGVENCHHGIGMAKPYGYGAVAIDIKLDNAIRNEAMLAFRAYMEAWWLKEELEGTWSESSQLQQIIAMARFSNQPEKLTYMDLDSFPEIKKENKALPRFTNFLGIESFSYPKSYQKEIKVFVENEKERLEAIAEAKRIEEEADKKAKAEKEIKEILAKGLILWLTEINSYGVLETKMNVWITMRNGECVNDETEVTFLLAIATKIRNKKAPKHREKFFNEKRTNDLIKWIGKEETEKFIQSFKKKS